MTKNLDAIQIRVHSRMDEFPANHWNRLIRGNYPFLNHAFLNALEQHQCVGQAVGWIPRHLGYWNADTLIAAMPLYEKHNSWGEFVFDHAWANAFERYGLDYYPKLVNAIPFTPASGQRIMLDGSADETSSLILISAANTLLDESSYSSVHSLFPDERDYRLLKQRDAFTRYDCQFHWHNRNYTSFDSFLDTLKFKKRKNIRRERQKVFEAGIEILWLDGHSANEHHWFEFTRLYQKIYNRKYGMPAFNQAFFMAIAERMPDQIQLVLAKLDDRIIAGALMYRDDTTLYGRHWGCDEYVDSLHFELCYYQGIAYCIENNLDRFDPGAQGEHKIARGFEATRTKSLHWIGDSLFSEAIHLFVKKEQGGVRHYIEAVKAHSPYRARD